MKFITRIGNKAQHECTKKLRKYDLPFLKQSARPYAACMVIRLSLEDKQHLEVGGTFINGGQFAGIYWLNVGVGKEQNIQDCKHWKQGIIPHSVGVIKNTKGIGNSGDKTTFMEQLQDDFIISSVTETFQITT